MNSYKKSRGFTLMELLVVIALIVILVAISIPIFSTQVKKSNETYDVAAIRSCYAEQQELLLMDSISVDDAVAEVDKLELKNESYYESSGSRIIYHAQIIKGSDNTGDFVWDFERTDLYD